MKRLLTCSNPFTKPNASVQKSNTAEAKDRGMRDD